MIVSLLALRGRAERTRNTGYSLRRPRFRLSTFFMNPIYNNPF